MYPPVLRSRVALLDILSSSPTLGLDLEYGDTWETRNKISIIGVSDGQRTASCNWNNDVIAGLRALARKNWVGHNLVSADFRVLAANGCLPAGEDFDTLILWYLTNAHLCTAVGKATIDSEGDRKGRGFMNIWTMASVSTDLPNWKLCRGDDCYGGCPVHDVFGYNGLDAYAPLAALPALQKKVKLLGVGGLYPVLSRNMAVCAAMRERGVCVDADTLNDIEAQLKQEKDKLLATLSSEVNWASPKQITEYFQSKYRVTLKSTGQEELERYTYPEARTLCEIKELGKGAKAWFDARYIDRSGYAHPTFTPCGTSTGRLSSSKPNFQNLPRRRAIGRLLRKAIIPRSKDLIFLKADWSQAENRTVLWDAGYKGEVPLDVHSWMTKEMDIGEDHPAARKLGGARDVGKRVIHATNYLEGLVLFDLSELKSDRRTREQRAGALLVFPEWRFQNKTVCFTGVNLASALFDSATWEARAEANRLVQKYFQAFPQVRDWQRRITSEVERDGCIRSPFGRFLLSYGREEEQLKTAAAFRGSGPVADYAIRAMNALEDEGIGITLQVHDELLFEVDRGEEEKLAGRVREIMETEYLPGLKLPVKFERGENYGDLQKV